MVVVLLKPGKDPDQPESYHPILLLNADLKLLTKVLAMGLSKVIAKLVHHDLYLIDPRHITFADCT